MSSTTTDSDDDVIYSLSTRNFFLRKLFDHLPYGSFKIIKADDDVCIEVASTRCMIFLQVGETWAQIKRLLAKEHGDPNTWECPVCFLNPSPAVLSTCDICLNSTCMKCFIEMFQQSRGQINCPFCRDDIGCGELTDQQLAKVVKRLRSDHGVPYK